MDQQTKIRHAMIDLEVEFYALSKSLRSLSEALNSLEGLVDHHELDKP